MLLAPRVWQLSPPSVTSIFSNPRLKQFGDERRPPCLMASTHTSAIIPVKILIKPDIVIELVVRLKLRMMEIDWANAIGVLSEQVP